MAHRLSLRDKLDIARATAAGKPVPERYTAVPPPEGPLMQLVMLALAAYSPARMSVGRLAIVAPGGLRIEVVVDSDSRTVAFHVALGELATAGEAAAALRQSAAMRSAAFLVAYQTDAGLVLGACSRVALPRAELQPEDARLCLQPAVEHVVAAVKQYRAGELLG